MTKIILKHAEYLGVIYVAINHAFKLEPEYMSGQNVTTPVVTF